jgi:hypothetical protein
MSGAIAEQAAALGGEADSALTFKLAMKPAPLEADAPGY